MNKTIIETIKLNVKNALEEDIGSGDITAELISNQQISTAQVLCRDQAIICGKPWVDETFKQFDSNVSIDWHVEEGELVVPNTKIFQLYGNTRSLLTTERTALNFLQLLSGIATKCHHYMNKIQHTNIKILDTRKTIPGLRYAQKYATKIGGCINHRMGLYDAFLIKENHINACGGITKSIQIARQLYPDKSIEIEVENLSELETALASNPDIIMLDNFTTENLKIAVTLTKGRVKLEASGNINEKNLLSIAETGVDYISLGDLTKNCKSIDLSMRILD